MIKGFSRACALALSGCVVVPVRLPTQTKDPFRNVHNLDFAFLKAYSTQGRK